MFVQERRARRQIDDVAGGVGDEDGALGSAQSPVAGLDFLHRPFGDGDGKSAAGGFLLAVLALEMIVANGIPRFKK